ncbi:hypothetical protein K488DRAFT_74418 [Vararia minispora EC-137]|uniref:Uncharacterized protein n=1 Tax=Vararia minispora EC-137 TaxID=1314806 RepID=A0ACB8Q7I9_9AGAM|nr:hypothetical protein K488DRAFT_74418 [Vararia minispora EC-137]
MAALNETIDPTSLTEPRQQFLSFGALSLPQHDQLLTTTDTIADVASPQSFDRFLEDYHKSGLCANSHGNEAPGTDGVVGASGTNTNVSYTAACSGPALLSPFYSQLDRTSSSLHAHHATGTNSVSASLVPLASPVPVPPAVFPAPAVVEPFPTIDFSGQHYADFGAPAVFDQAAFGVPHIDPVQSSSQLVEHFPSALGPGALYYGSAPQGTFNGKLDESPVFSLQEVAQNKRFAESNSNVNGFWGVNGADWVATAQGTQGPAAAGPSRVALDAPHALACPSRYNQRNLEHVIIPRSAAQIPTPDLTPERLNFPPVSGPSSAKNHYSVGGVIPGLAQYETSGGFPTESRGSVGPVGWAPETETQLTQPMIPAEDTGEEYAPPDHPPPNYHRLAIGSATPRRPDALSFIRCKGATRRPPRAQKSPSSQWATEHSTGLIAPATAVQHLQQAPAHSLDSSIYGKAYFPDAFLPTVTPHPDTRRSVVLPHAPAQPAAHLRSRPNKRRREDGEPAGPSKRLHRQTEVAVLAPSPILYSLPTPSTSTSALGKRKRSESHQSAPIAGPSRIPLPPADPFIAPTPPSGVQPRIKRVRDKDRLVYPATFVKQIKETSQAEKRTQPNLSGFFVELGDAAEHHFRRSDRERDPRLLCTAGDCGETFSDRGSAIRHFVSCARKNDEEHIQCLKTMPLDFRGDVRAGIPKPCCRMCGKEFSRRDAVVRHERDACPNRPGAGKASKR